MMACKGHFFVRDKIVTLAAIASILLISPSRAGTCFGTSESVADPQILSTSYSSDVGKLDIGIRILGPRDQFPVNISVVISTNPFLNLPEKSSDMSGDEFIQQTFKVKDLTINSLGETSLPPIIVKNNKIFSVFVKSEGCASGVDYSGPYSVKQGVATLDPGVVDAASTIRAWEFDLAKFDGTGKHLAFLEIPKNILGKEAILFTINNGDVKSTADAESIENGFISLATSSFAVIDGGSSYKVFAVLDSPIDNLTIYRNQFFIFKRVIGSPAILRKDPSGYEELVSEIVGKAAFSSSLTSSRFVKNYTTLAALLAYGVSVDNGIDLKTYLAGKYSKLTDVSTIVTELKTYSDAGVSRGLRLIKNDETPVSAWPDAYSLIPLSFIFRDGRLVSVSTSEIEKTSIPVDVKWKGSVDLFYEEGGEFKKFNAICQEEGSASGRECVIKGVNALSLANKRLWAKVSSSTNCPSLQTSCPSVSAFNFEFTYSVKSVSSRYSVLGSVDPLPILKKVDKRYSISGTIDKPIVSTVAQLSNDYDDLWATPGESHSYMLATDKSRFRLKGVSCIGSNCKASTSPGILDLVHDGKETITLHVTGTGTDIRSGKNTFVASFTGDGSSMDKTILVAEKDVQLFEGTHLIIGGFSMKDNIGSKARSVGKKYAAYLKSIGIKSVLVSAVDDRFSAKKEFIYTLPTGQEMEVAFRGLTLSDLSDAVKGKVMKITYFGHSVEYNKILPTEDPVFDPIWLGYDYGAPILGTSIRKDGKLTIHTVLPSKPEIANEMGFSLDLAPSVEVVSLGCNSAREFHDSKRGINRSGWASNFQRNWGGKASGTLGYTLYPSQFFDKYPNSIPGFLTSSEGVTRDQLKEIDGDAVSAALRVVNDQYYWSTLKYFSYPRMVRASTNLAGNQVMEDYTLDPYLQPKNLP